MADVISAHDHPIVTRTEAKASGARRYFTGKPCYAGHVAERRVSTRVCTICSSTKAATNYVANREQILAQQAAYRKANPEKKSVQRAAYRQANQAKILAYHKANPEKHRVNGRNRKARLRQAIGKHSEADIALLMKLQRGKCAHSWCMKRLSTGYHIDHIIALATGGSNDKRNLQLLCKSCNLRKHTTHPIDYAQRHGMLL